ncbi:MAG: diaminopimelate decarboxylase, partial [Candidatus Nanopelagicales bacterium]
MRAHPAGPRHGDVVTHAALPPQPAGDFADLDPAVWPRTAMRGPDGSLVVGGCDVRDLARAHGTPLFILDEVDFRTRAAAFRTSY